MQTKYKSKQFSFLSPTLFRFLSLLLALLLLLPLFSGCGELPDGAQILLRYCETHALPRGKLYLTPSEPWEPHYFPPELKEALFPHRELPPFTGGIYLSADLFAPFEIGVFVFPSERDAELLALLLTERLHRLERIFPGHPNLLSAKIQVTDTAVCMAVAEDAEKILSALRP